MKLTFTCWTLLLAAVSISAQDTLITTTADTLLVQVRSINDEHVSFYRIGEADRRLKADLGVIEAILFQNKTKNKDYYSDPAKRLEKEIRDTSRLWVVITNDGNEFVGSIQENTPEYIRLETASLGPLSIPKASIRRIRQTKSNTKIVDGEAWLDYPQSTRYFLAPNGYGLKAGEGYYQNIWILFNQFSYGITDNISMGLGFAPLFLFDFTPTPVWITPKFSIPIKEDHFNVGGGALIATVIGESEGSTLGIAYGVSTLGSRDQNVTLGLGYGFAGGGWAKAPTITLGGMTRLGKRGYLLTENYFISTVDDPVFLMSLGGRSIWSNFSLDYGAILPLSTAGSDPIILPWLGFSVSFGK